MPDAVGIAVGDLSFVETHDCFTIAELIIYEAMDLAELGLEAHIALDGVTATDACIPVNCSGGLKAEGHRCPADADGPVQRVAGRFGLFAAARVLPWPEGEATEAARIRLATWILAEAGASTTQIMAILSLAELYTRDAEQEHLAAGWMTA